VELKIDSGSGLPNELAGVRVAVLSCDCTVLPLDDAVDWDWLFLLDCKLSENTRIFCFGWDAASSKSAASAMAS
jgi:hypothetical protein